MKLKLLSDLHMESYGFKYTHSGEDVLILAGDINSNGRHMELLDHIPAHVQVLLVAGNHEFYGQEYFDTLAQLERLEQEYSNFTFLDDDTTTIGDYAVYGGTMFTDFGCHGEVQRWFAKHAAKDMVADFHHITKLGKRWTTEDHVHAHAVFCEGLDAWIRTTQGQPRIVVSHFMPLEACGSKKFAGNTLNPYFCADMSKYMGQVDYWFHGHGHSSVDITVGGTRILANPRGYGAENHSGFNRDLIVEI